MNDDILRRRALELVRAGRLPGRRPERVWGGSGVSGVECALCGGRFERDDVALEVEVRRDERASYPSLHARCFAAFERALEAPDAAIDDRNER